MRRCDTPEEVAPAFERVKSDAKKAFGNEDIFIEKYLVEPKHIEVQVLGDQYGNIVHLGERDCSLQRRYQKVVEFAPVWSVPEATRQALYEDAIKVARHIGYISAGTVEFLVDKQGNHYFIEMNPRIQVEHTVTEMVTVCSTCAWTATPSSAASPPRIRPTTSRPTSAVSPPTARAAASV